MTRAIALCIVVAALAAVGDAPGQAAVPVTIDSRAVTLATGENGGWTVSLGFTNLTDAPAALTAAPGQADVGCDIALAPSSLPPAQHTGVTAVLPAMCAVADDGIDFVVTPDAGSPFQISAGPAAASGKPEWRALAAFPISLLAFLVLGVLAVIATRSNLLMPLKGLGASWSFKDSWVSNITVIGAVLTGIFGSADVVKALLGEDAENAVALATVGAAVAAALVAVGSIFLLATKSHGMYTFGGFLGAAAITMAGATGEVWVDYRSASALDLGGWENFVVYAAAVVLALLVLYAVRTALDIIHQGLGKKGFEGPSPGLGMKGFEGRSPEAPPRRTAALL